MPHTHFARVSCIAHAAVAGGLSTGALAAAIAVPLAVVLAALLACCCIRRRNLRHRRAAAALAQEERDKDLEAGPAYYNDTDRVRDQLGRTSQVRRLEAAQHSTACLSVEQVGRHWGWGGMHTSGQLYMHQGWNFQRLSCWAGRQC
jgi:hypothetical protein